MIALGTAVCPIILEKVKYLLKKNENLHNTNLEMTDEIKDERTYATLRRSSMEISMFIKVKAQVFDVKGMMMDIVEKVMLFFMIFDRGKMLNILVDKTKNLRNRFWRRVNYRIWLSLLS
ncbi:hypothetical protein GIB67_002566 [Kingdonia uniflora]|uniref:Uncharacterized protein n=1 Tax=Kingdonia uniflora TaxID=39325 RepID=A0A7J7N422_9MAGN|nr:hypothetical protein GIB67_002566 [Kingdonia uniflora]